jgi:hypothetical protein
VDHTESIQARAAMREEREKEWEEVWLYEALVRGPKEGEAASWDGTLDRLDQHIGGHGKPLLDNLYGLEPVEEGQWDDKQRHDHYLGTLREAKALLHAYVDSRSRWRGSQADEGLRRVAREGLDRLARKVSEALREQGRRPRSEDQVMTDYLNAGTVTRYRDSKVTSLVTDIHGMAYTIANCFLPEAVLSPDRLLVESDPSPGRRLGLRRDHCVRLITDGYAHLGMPRGMEGYVISLVSNEALGWTANNCQIMVVLAYQGRGMPWEEDFLEVAEDELEVCTKGNPPSKWFPFETSGDGLVKRTRSGGFRVRGDAQPYTHEERIGGLAGPPATSPERPAGTPRQGSCRPATPAPEARQGREAGGEAVGAVSGGLFQKEAEKG